MVDEMLEELSEQVCLGLLHGTVVGRIAVVVEHFPVVVPVNYRMVELGGAPAIVLCTRAGNVIDSGATKVAVLQIDGIDPTRHCGWSVLARGLLHHLDAKVVAALREQLEPLSWVTEGRDSWLAIEELHITGRRFRAADVQWAFDIRGYL